MSTCPTLFIGHYQLKSEFGKSIVNCFAFGKRVLSPSIRSHSDSFTVAAIVRFRSQFIPAINFISCTPRITRPESNFPPSNYQLSMNSATEQSLPAWCQIVPNNRSTPTRAPSAGDYDSLLGHMRRINHLPRRDLSLGATAPPTAPSSSTSAASRREALLTILDDALKIFDEVDEEDLWLGA